MITVMHVHWRFAVGGAETHLFELALAQKRLGLTPIIVANFCSSKYLDEFKRNDISFYVVKELSDIAELITLHNVSLLHAHSSRMYQKTIDLSEDYNVPSVFTLHGPGAIRKIDAGKATGLIAVSQELHDKVKILYPGCQVTVIENGINLANHIPLPQNNGVPCITYVGRVDSKKIKGVLNLHEAILQLDNKVKFTSVSTLRKKSFDPKCGTLIKDAIDSSDVLNKSDIVVGTGRAIMEGMGSGNVGVVLGEFYDGPVTPENVGKLRYANFSGRSSRKVPNSSAILNDLRILTEFPTVLSELKKWSHEYATKHFDIEEKAKEHLNSYSKVLGKPLF